MKRALALTAVALTATLAVAACGGDDTRSSTADSTTSSKAQAGAAGTPAAGEQNDADVMFAQGMIPHHAQAVEMSDLVLGKDGVDPAVQELARDIKAAQAPEIEQMTGWLLGWGEDVPGTAGAGAMDGMDHGGMDMPGMMSDEDMASLEDASGEQASQLFLEQMIEHHRGAIEMAEGELDGGRNEDAKELAQQIIDAQESEITAMTQLLGS